MNKLSTYPNGSNAKYSISTNDLTQTQINNTKMHNSNKTSTIKLPPVVLNNSSTNEAINHSSSILIGGSTNNMNSISLAETISKKKISDLSRYCSFCRKKTGLVSSYMCR